MATGALCGLCIHLDQAKWIQLGRDAFLAAQGHRFDQYSARQGTVAGYVIISAIFTLGLGVLFEGIVYAGDKIVNLLVPRKSAKP